jgi:peptidoglycan/LPS O-acetylase OafA/YrhL
VKPGAEAGGAAATSPPAAVALGGVAVLLLMLQGSAGFPVELLGVDLLLVAAGFRVTHALLTAAVVDGRMPLAAWYGRQFGLRVPLLVLSSAMVLGIAMAGRPEPAGQAGLDALAGQAGAGNWWLLAGRTGLADALGVARDWYADRPGTINPFGLLWLVGLLIQLALGWPLLLAVLRRAVGARDRQRVARRLFPLLLLLTYLAWLVGPLRSASGAPLAELALGTHVRLVEFLLGAMAAAAVVALAERRIPRWHPLLPTALGVLVVVSAAVLASADPIEWLRLGGPAGAALGGALILVGASLPTDGALPAALGRGLPRELGVAAYPLLLLHLPVFWLIQMSVPTVRPAALLLTGGALAWLVGLLVQDGLIRRWRQAWRPAAAVALLLVAAMAVGAAGAGLHLSSTDVPPQVPIGEWQATGGGQAAEPTGWVSAAPGRAADRPVVLVLGGSTGGDMAAALAAADSPYAVRDATRPGCGLLPSGLPQPQRPRVSADAQLGGPQALPCGGWQQRWSAEIARHRPVAVLLDLGADAAPARVPDTAPTPCDPGFRSHYRVLIAEAVAVLADPRGAPPVLLADARAGVGETGAAARCFSALVAEAVASYPTLVPLDFEALLCPGGVCRTATEFGRPSYDVAHLSTVERGELGPWLAAAVTAELEPARVAARQERVAASCGAAEEREAGGAGC